MVINLRSAYFFFNDTATTEIYTLSLHDALPISDQARAQRSHLPLRDPQRGAQGGQARRADGVRRTAKRSEEHTSELQSPDHLVCRLLLEKKNTTTPTSTTTTPR